MKIDFRRRIQLPAILRDPMLYAFLWETFGFLFAAFLWCCYAHGMSNGHISLWTDFGKVLWVPPIACLFIFGLRLLMPRIWPTLLFLGHLGSCGYLVWNFIWTLEHGMEHGNFANTFGLLILIGYFSLPTWLLWFEVRKQLDPEFSAIFRFFRGASSVEASSVETFGTDPADGGLADQMPRLVPWDDEPGRSTHVSWRFELCVFLVFASLCAWVFWYFGPGWHV